MILSGWKATLVVGSLVTSSIIGIGGAVVSVLSAKKLKDIDSKLDELADEVIPDHKKNKNKVSHAPAANA